MPQKFFTRSIESDFIKQLLRKEPVPIMDAVVKGRTVYNGYSYVYDGDIIKCTKTGVLGEDATYCITTPVVDSKFCFGNFTSRTTYYDGETHYQLGNYLRYYRDSTGVDLMPFYNCFNYTTLTDLYLSRAVQGTLDKGYVAKKNDNYKVFAVPVKMNMEYTIFIDCQQEVLLKPIFYNEYGLVIDSSTKIPLVDEVMIGSGDDKKWVLSFDYMSFKHPQKIEMSLSSNDENNGISEESIYNYQKYLYLAIQVPSTNNSSIVVLEGDYTGRYFKYFGADAYSDGEARSEILGRQNYLMLRQPSLAFCNTGTTFAFSDRLIEYLLWNVITSEEPLDGNISFVQRNIDGNRLKGYFDGVWSPNIRASLWYKYKEGLGRFEEDANVEYCNLFDKNTVENNKQLTITGGVSTWNGYAVSDYIPVDFSRKYVCVNYARKVFFYKSDKTWISSLAPSNTTEFRRRTIPSNASYVRFDYQKSVVGNNDIILLNGDFSSSDFPSYAPYLEAFYEDVGDGFLSNSNEMLDMNGYVDKDMEKILTKG